MTMSVGSSLQALSAFSTAQAVSANNIANSLTPGFEASSVSFEDTSQGGVRVAAISSGALPGGLAASPDASLAQAASNTNYAIEFTTMIANQTAFSANLAAISTSDQMAGTLLNISV